MRQSETKSRCDELGIVCGTIVDLEWNSKLFYEELEMKSQLKKRVTSEIIRDAVTRIRHYQRGSWNFDRGKTQTGILQPEGSPRQEGQRTLA